MPRSFENLPKNRFNIKTEMVVSAILQEPVQSSKALFELKMCSNLLLNGENDELNHSCNKHP